MDFVWEMTIYESKFQLEKRQKIYPHEQKWLFERLSYSQNYYIKTAIPSKENLD